MFFKNILLIFFCCICYSSFAVFELDGLTLFAEELIYDRYNNYLDAKNKVLLFNQHYALYADHIIYNHAEKNLYASDNILIKDNNNNMFFASKVKLFNNQLLIDNLFIRSANQISTVIASNSTSDLNKNITYLKNVCYSACSRDEFENPIWQIRAKEVEIDQKNKMATYNDIYFDVFGFPIIYLPYLYYPIINADAKSGFLLPNYSDGNLRIPIYFRVLSNLDFTITPRIIINTNISAENIIFEFQFRHLLKFGQYNIETSMANKQHIWLNNSEYLISKKTKYHFFSTGKFDFTNFQISFNLKRATDPAYLRQYYNIYDPYLESDVSIQNINYDNYIKFKLLYFQDIRVDQASLQNSFSFPYIEFKRIIDLDYGVELTFDSINLFYSLDSAYEVFRSSNIINFYKTLEFKNHFIDLNFYNKLDLYKYNYNYGLALNAETSKKNTNLAKIIPELHLTWSYPLILQNIIFEPVVTGCLKLISYVNNDIIPIDSEDRFELSDLNLTQYSRFSGRDYDESGPRVSYGLNTQILLDAVNYSIFFGQTYTNKIKGDFVGNLIFNYQDTKFFYRFNTSHLLKIKMQELGIQYITDKFKLFADLFYASDEYMDKYFKYKKIYNLTAKIKYNISDHWSLDFSATFDLIKKPITLIRSIGVTYNYDCVRISLGISDNFTNDPTRNVKKAISGKPSFFVGLKTLNI